MIRIILGGVGSGKTLSVVREMILNPRHRKVYSNIITNKVKNNVVITPDMLIKKEVVKQIKKRDGSLENVYEKKLNVDFWKSIKEPIDVVIDEAHNVMDSRRSMSKTNILMNQWLSMIRRVLGSQGSGYGELTIISQLDNRIDCIAREMATSVRYHKMIYRKTCQKCKLAWQETNEEPEPVYSCPRCGCIDLIQDSHCIEVWHFRSMKHYQEWNDFKMKTYHMHYILDNVKDYFGCYDTFQWKDMISDQY